MPIAVFTAMECEYQAVKLLLEQNGSTELDRHGNLIGQIKGLGGNHEIILPAFVYGRDATASSATSVLERFPKVSYLIFIGVAGGVPPSKAGDLVISESVVDIEYAKLNPDGTIKHRSQLLQPSGKLMNFVKAIQANISTAPVEWRDHIIKLLISSDKNLSEKWQALLNQNIPIIRLGNIGTSMRIVNDPKVRDEWAKSDYRIRAFEMEGGGIAATANLYDKGYLLIRGVSDASDGNRNDETLQPYASRVAAAFLSILLEHVPPETETTIVKREETLVEEKSTIEKSNAIIDWSDAPEDQIFKGRTNELKKLSDWIYSEHGNCRLIAILGMGGIGKTSVAVQIVKQLSNDFRFIIWRSLKNRPPLQEVLRDCVDLVSNHKIAELPSDSDRQISILSDLLRTKRCLIILDNFESILKKGQASEEYIEDYENYGEFIRRIGAVQHKSCLLLTSSGKTKRSRGDGGGKPACSFARLSGLRCSYCEGYYPRQER